MTSAAGLPPQSSRLVSSRGRPASALGAERVKGTRRATAATPRTWACLALARATRPVGAAAPCMPALETLTTLSPAGGRMLRSESAICAVGDVGGAQLQHRGAVAAGVDGDPQRNAGDGIPSQLRPAQQPAGVLGRYRDRVRRPPGHVAGAGATHAADVDVPISLARRDWICATVGTPCAAASALAPEAPALSAGSVPS